MAVLSNGIYSPQNFIEVLTDKYYIINESPLEKIHGILVKEGLEDDTYNTIWDYSLDEINEIVENDISVVLVDVSHFNEDGEWVTECRWFEIPESCCDKFKNLVEV